MKKINFNVIARIVIALALGALAPFVGLLGAEPFEVPGQNSIAERLSGGVVLALYLAFCQFMLSRKEEAGRATRWSVVVALAVPVLAWAVCFAWRDGPGSVTITSVPLLAAGGCGIGAGAYLAARRAAKKTITLTGGN